MRSFIALLLFTTLGMAQVPGTPKTGTARNCRANASLLYEPVLHAMWLHDEDEQPDTQETARIRVSVHPTWDQEFFADIQLNKSGSPTIILYSLPKGVNSVMMLIKRALKERPCAEPIALAAMLPIRRQMVAPTKKIDELLSQFLEMRWETRRRILDVVRLDTTQYELEFVGEDTIQFRSDEYDTPIVKWIDSFFSAVDEASSRGLTGQLEK